MDPGKIEHFKDLSAKVRRNIIKSIYTAEAGHPGGSLSTVELLLTLYYEVMNIDPDEPDKLDRDRFVLSKGHASIALYAVLAERGFFPVEELATFDELNTRMQSHPDMNVTPGIDMSTGSLGQGLSAGLGMAMGARLMGLDFHTYVLLGDGEIQEGQIWEAADWASNHRITNLTAILDFNRYQLCECGFPGETTTCRDPGARFQAFGWRTIEVDGHDYNDILNGFRQTVEERDHPAILIAHTIKGKGVSFMENTCSWHAKAPNDEECRMAMTELAG
jgi:transketolase